MKALKNKKTGELAENTYGNFTKNTKYWIVNGEPYNKYPISEWDSVNATVIEREKNPMFLLNIPQVKAFGMAILWAEQDHIQHLINPDTGEPSSQLRWRYQQIHDKAIDGELLAELEKKYYICHNCFIDTDGKWQKRNTTN